MARKAGQAKSKGRDRSGTEGGGGRGGACQGGAPGAPDCGASGVGGLPPGAQEGLPAAHPSERPKLAAATTAAAGGAAAADGRVSGQPLPPAATACDLTHVGWLLAEFHGQLAAQPERARESLRAAVLHLQPYIASIVAKASVVATASRPLPAKPTRPAASARARPAPAPAPSSGAAPARPAAPANGLGSGRDAAGAPARASRRPRRQPQSADFTLDSLRTLSPGSITTRLGVSANIPDNEGRPGVVFLQYKGKAHSFEYSKLVASPRILGGLMVRAFSKMTGFTVRPCQPLTTRQPPPVAPLSTSAPQPPPLRRPATLSTVAAPPLAPRPAAFPTFTAPPLPLRPATFAAVTAAPQPMQPPPLPTAPVGSGCLDAAALARLQLMFNEFLRQAAGGPSPGLPAAAGAAATHGLPPFSGHHQLPSLIRIKG